MIPAVRPLALAALLPAVFGQLTLQVSDQSLEVTPGTPNTVQWFNGVPPYTVAVIDPANPLNMVASLEASTQDTTFSWTPNSGILNYKQLQLIVQDSNATAPGTAASTFINITSTYSPLTVEPLGGASSGEMTEINWSGGIPPYKVTVRDFRNPSTIYDYTSNGTTENSVQWGALGEGRQAQAVIEDATGWQVATSPVTIGLLTVIEF
ncbi:hypothetical protein MNV49_003678 [Pseudohyphozyma bogoriensis]|nr:hypothetical protein MNV49_003678 [Pseudohyphozyma bogoriensis]